MHAPPGAVQSLPPRRVLEHGPAPQKSRRNVGAALDFSSADTRHTHRYLSGTSRRPWRTRACTPDGRGVSWACRSRIKGADRVAEAGPAGLPLPSMAATQSPRAPATARQNEEPPEPSFWRFARLSQIRSRDLPLCSRTYAARVLGMAAFFRNQQRASAARRRSWWLLYAAGDSADAASAQTDRGFARR